MGAPRWEAIDDDTADLLTLVADESSPIGRDVPDLFLDACRRDAMAHDGLVSVNRVRMLLADRDIPPRRYSAMWSNFTGAGRPMVKSDEWETCEGSTSGNDGRPFKLRVWVGESA